MFLIMVIQRLLRALGAPAVNRILITGSGIQHRRRRPRWLPVSCRVRQRSVRRHWQPWPVRRYSMAPDLILLLTIATAAGVGPFILYAARVTLGNADGGLNPGRLTVTGPRASYEAGCCSRRCPDLVVAVAAGAACALALPPGPWSARRWTCRYSPAQAPLSWCGPT